MPIINGIEVTKLIKEKNNTLRIIFCTANFDYVYEAYSIQVVDYIFKPFDYERVIANLEKIIEEH